jgi:hypothetical protein
MTVHSTIKYTSIIGFLFFSCLVVLSCNKENSAKDVFLKWQKLIDENKFSEAATLGTSRCKEWLKTMEKMNSVTDPEFASTEVVYVKYDSIACQILNDTSCICRFKTKDEIGVIEDSIYLFRQGRNWLVDIPISEQPSEEDTEDFLDELNETVADTSYL